MFRKLISILLIFTVNAFLLAHSVLPHHHHDGIPHFSFSAFTNHDDHQTENDHRHNSCCCHHDKKCDTSSCFLDQEIDIIHEINDDTCVVCHSAHGYSHWLAEVTLLFYTFDFLQKGDNPPLKRPPYLISYHFEYLNSLPGFRAPPIRI